MRDCADCADLLTGHQMLLDAVELLDQPTLRSDFAIGVAADFNARRKRRQFARTVSWLSLASAAVVLIGFGIHFVGRPSRTTQIVKQVDDGPADVPRAPNPVAPQRQFVLTYPQFNLDERQRELVGQMADGLKPVANSMSAALDALRRTFPGAETAPRSS